MRRSWTSRSADVVLVTVALLAADVALAGSCCTGPTTSVPSRLGREEVATGGVSLTGGGTVARWSSSGGVTPASPGEGRLNVDVFGGFRLDPRAQVSLSLPVIVQHVGVGAAGEWGAGTGDTRLTLLVEPLVELRGPEGRPGAPVPMVGVGLRLPTGRSFDEARLPLRTDGTVEGDAALFASVQVERTIDRVPWSVSVGGELGVGDHGPRPALDVAAGVGGSFDVHWALFASLSHRERWVDGLRTGRTTAGLRLQHAWPGLGRLWAGVNADLGVPGLGVDLPVEVKGLLGFALVR